MRNFKKWFRTIRNGVTSWDYYTDFDKAKRNLSSYEKQINQINKIIHNDDIENELKKLFIKDKKIINVLPMLLAVRSKKMFINHKSQELIYDFENVNQNIEMFMTFVENTGIVDMLKQIKGDLYDYMFGIEVGMDTNARKNRSGSAMEVIVEAHLLKLGFIRDKTYWKQFELKNFKKVFGIALPKKVRTANRRFDFVVKSKNKIFIIETNVYQGGGSKLASICDTYIQRNEIFTQLKNVKYIWITDGKGWFDEKDDLRDAFSKIPHLYNLTDLEHSQLKKILK